MTAPNPDKFAQYTPLPDGSGFTLSNGKTYKYDKDGGWFDEFNNYYDKNGTPAIKTPSKRFEEFLLLEDKTGFKLKDGSTFYFDKQGGWFHYLFIFGGVIFRYDEQKVYYNSKGIECPPPVEEQKSFAEEKKEMKDKAIYSINAQLQKNKDAQYKQPKIATINEQCLNFYKENPENTEIKFYFKFENVYVKGREIIEFLKQGIQEINIKEFGFDYNDAEKRDKKGTGWFVCKNKFSALQCIKCNNANLSDSLFQLSFEPFQIEKKSQGKKQKDYDQQQKMKPKKLNNHLEEKPMKNKHLFE